MTGVRARFEAMIEDLQLNGNVTLIHASIAPRAPEGEIDEARRRAQGTLPEGVEDFYREMNGMRLEWEHRVAAIRTGDDRDKGYIDILPVLEVWKEWMGSTWFDDIEGGDAYRAVKPFDRFVPEACAAFCQPEGAPPESTMYYHYFGEHLENTRYSFPDYLDRLIASRGYFYWIQTLCTSRQDSGEVAAFRRNMPVIFPDHDDRLFVPKASG